MSDRSESFVLGPGEGPSVRNPVGGDAEIKVRGEQSDGALAVVESVAAPGEGPPLHTHANEDEGIYVLEGEFRFKLGDEITPAPSGSFVFIRRGEAHTWQCVGETPGRILVIFTPAGMERFFEGFAAVDAPGPETFASVASEVQMDVVGPPLAQSDPF